jgi:hypothetical protein
MDFPGMKFEGDSAQRTHRPEAFGDVFNVQERSHRGEKGMVRAIGSAFGTMAHAEWHCRRGDSNSFARGLIFSLDGCSFRLRGRLLES